MAELHGIQNLEESTLGQEVVAHEIALFGDAGEQVAFGAEFNDHVCTIHGIHDAHQGDDIGMLAGQMVELDLTLLVLQLAGIQTGLVEGLDRIQDIGMDIHGGVDHAIGADTKNAGEFQPVG